MTRVLAYFASSVPACSASIAIGVGIMLSVANLDPMDLMGILARQTLGGICLLAPAVVQRWRQA
jgi:hypothetical protein